MGAQSASPTERDSIVAAMRTAVHRAGSPWWAVATEHRWTLERAIAAGDAGAAADAADRLAELADRHPALAGDAETAATWAAVLAGRVVPAAVTAGSHRLVEAGRRWEAAALCRTAVARATDPAVARELTGTGRALRTAPTPGRTAGELSEREREVGALVIDGLTHKEIGARLYISPRPWSSTWPGCARSWPRATGPPWLPACGPAWRPDPLADHRAESPPSTARQTPVTYDAASLARNSAVAATSHTDPIRFSGTARLRAATSSSTPACAPASCGGPAECRSSREAPRSPGSPRARAARPGCG